MYLQNSVKVNTCLYITFAWSNILCCMPKLSKWYLGYKESIRNNTTKLTRNVLSKVSATEFYTPVTVSVRKCSLLVCLLLQNLIF